MEFKGADFIKKVQRQKEVEELRRRLEELEQLNNTPSSSKATQHTSYSQVDDDEVESFEKTFYQTSYGASNGNNDEIQDIAIPKQPTKQPTLPVDKKKFAVLGFFLIIVFVFTVIVIRFFMNYASTQNDLLEPNTPVVDEKAIEQKFEKIVTQAKEMNITDANKTNQEQNATASTVVEHPSLTPVVATQAPTPTPTPQATPQVVPAPQQVKPTIAAPAPTPTQQITKQVQPTPPAKVAEKVVTPPKEIKQQEKPKPIVAEQTIQKKKEEPKPAPVAPKRDMQELFGLKKDQKTQSQKSAETIVQTKNKEAVLKEELKAKKVEQKVVEKPTLAAVKPLPPYKPANKPAISQQNVTPKAETKQQENTHQTSTQTPTNTKKYIQAGSFYTYAPSPDYINKLNASGYPYKIQRSQTANGTTLDRVLIGPFSEDEAKAQLSKIKQVVTPGAFIIK